MSTVGCSSMLLHTKINSLKFPTLSPVCRMGNRKIRIKTQKKTNPGIAQAIFGPQRRLCYGPRSRRLEVVGRQRERAGAPVFSCVHYFQAPATRANHARASNSRGSTVISFCLNIVYKRSLR